MADNSSFSVSNVSATSASFVLRPGHYLVSASASWGGGSCKLQRLGPDQTTYLSVGADFTANGTAAIYIPGGQFVFTIATASAVYAEVVPIDVP